MSGRGGDPRRDRVKVSSGAVWSVTRPTDGAAPLTLDGLREALEPIWTFYAAQLASPSLARLLAPFELLDEIAADVAAEVPHAPGLEALRTRLLASFAAHHVATFPGLGLAVVPVRLARPAATDARFGRTRLAGALALASPGAAQPHPEAPSAALRLRIDHRGVHLEGECPAPPPGATLALVPTEAEGQLPAAAWVERLAADGLVVLALPPLAGAPALDLGVHLQVQRLAVEARASGALVAAGAADLGYFRERWRKHGESSRRSP